MFKIVSLWGLFSTILFALCCGFFLGVRSYEGHLRRKNRQLKEDLEEMKEKMLNYAEGRI